MTWWQVQAEMPDGGQMLFGVQAEDQGTAAAEVARALAGTGYVGAAVQEIPPPEERLPCSHNPAAA